MSAGLRAAGWGLLVVGILATGVGFVALGILPVRVNGRTCGNAYDTRPTAGFGLTYGDIRDDCSGPLHSRRVAAFTVGGIGAGLVALSIAGLIVPANVIDRQKRRTADLA